MLESDPLWYKDAIIYELHVKAFFDSNDDGIGDFPGLIQKLDYLQDLGINCIWLLPFYPSPLRDDGYDIADYFDVHESYGTKKDFKQFVREAHRRGIRVITELVVNHTSDQHEWFQTARRSPPGSVKRDFYVWSDTPDKYSDARIIFTDTETSNWTWDPVAQAYYWHRFFHHQPDLNYDNPHVLRAVIKVMRYWLDIGVDGLRLDAIPYLVEREGTNCENLPESHEILKQFRKELDANYENRMLLAEANQWPADVLPYFGDGDECHMSFHFPLMPRIFMALRQEDRHPIVEIMRQTPDIPPECQWALFLRNHDELTLEMVTDEERDYMYREYAADPRMRLNIGIRRRLAPLIGNSRLRIQLLNSLLFSFPGTPVIYYGDEIGMGDNIYLGDRNGVRTPMQWTGDRNAGFSRADFHKLYSPPVMDPVYGYQAINVEAQQRSASSLLNWMKRLIALRKRFKAFGRGSIQFLHPANRKVLAYFRRYENELILAVANLSRFVQPVELDLSEYKGYVPVELFGRVRFPPIGELPYFLTLGPTSFVWFQLEPESQVIVAGAEQPATPEPEELPAVKLPGGWETLMEGATRATLERTVLPKYLRRQRWFGGKTQTLETVSIRDWTAVVKGSHPAYLVVVRAYYSDGGSDLYLLSIATADGDAADQMLRDNSPLLLARVRGRFGEGAIYDAVGSDEFCTQLLTTIEKQSELRTQTGQVIGLVTSVFPEIRGDSDLSEIKRGSAEQSNSTIFYDRRLILKLFRRLDAGVNPDYEIGRFLTEKTNFTRTPRTAGAIEYRRSRREPVTLALLQEFVPNQGQGWEWILEVVGRYFEQIAGEDTQLGKLEEAGRSLVELSDIEPAEGVREAVGAALHSAEVLGQRTAEMHLALGSDPTIPEFAPEPMTAADLKALSSRLEKQWRQAVSLLKKKFDTIPEESQPLAMRVLEEGPALVEKIARLPEAREDMQRIRCHGDYHLGQVLWVENDFVILDFEGEPSRSIAERRAKQSPLKDVAGMLRSFDYAAYSGLLAFTEDRPDDFPRLEPWAHLWRMWVSAQFLRAYRQTIREGNLLPDDLEALRRLLSFFMLEKTIFELQYELNYRPNWVRIPIFGMLHLIQETE